MSGTRIVPPAPVCPVCGPRLECDAEIDATADRYGRAALDAAEAEFPEMLRVLRTVVALLEEMARADPRYALPGWATARHRCDPAGFDADAGAARTRLGWDTAPR